MYVLAIDTSTDAVVTGVARMDRDGTARPEVLADQAVSDGRRHAEVLTTLIRDALEEASVRRSDLDAVVVGCGPGPFTGLRVGMATAAAFADALDLPVYGVCSLDAIVEEELAVRGDVGSVLVVSDARRREIYWATYRDAHRISGPDVTAPAHVVADLAETPIDLVLGSPAHTGLFGRPVGGTTVPTVAGLVGVAAVELGSGTAPGALVPMYLRRPDAVEPKRRRPAERAGVVR